MTFNPKFNHQTGRPHANINPSIHQTPFANLLATRSVSWRPKPHYALLRKNPPRATRQCCASSVTRLRTEQDKALQKRFHRPASQKRGPANSRFEDSSVELHLQHKYTPHLYRPNSSLVSQCLEKQTENHCSTDAKKIYTCDLNMSWSVDYCQTLYICNNPTFFTLQLLFTMQAPLWVSLLEKPQMASVYKTN